jgi:hypothetical protein
MNQYSPWQPSKPFFAQPLDCVPEKLSQHGHKKDGAQNIAVVNLLIPVVNGRLARGPRPADKNQQGPYRKRSC